MNLSIVIHEFLQRYSRVVLPRVGVGVGEGVGIGRLSFIRYLSARARNTAATAIEHPAMNDADAQMVGGEC